MIPSPLVNRLLERCSLWEHRLLCHLPVPFGTSRMAVLEKPLRIVP